MEWSDFELPIVGPEMELLVSYGVYGRTLNGQGETALYLEARELPDKGKTLQVDLQQEPGESPVVTVNGKPFFPVILSTFYRMNQTGYENTSLSKEGILLPEQMQILSGLLLNI